MCIRNNHNETMSSNASAYYKLFNGQVSELFQELIQLCPSTIKIKEANIMFDVAKNLDPTMPLDTFAKQVLPLFGDKLRAHEESFFLSHDFNEDLLGMSSWNVLVDTLRNLWKSHLDSDGKTAMWKYIDNLVVLAEKVHA